MILMCLLLLAGWGLAAFAAAREVQMNKNRKISPFRPAAGPLNWRLFGPYLLGIVLCAWGGAMLQHDDIGYWALPVAFVPFWLAYIAPVRRHNSRLRRSHMG